MKPSQNFSGARGRTKQQQTPTDFGRLYQKAREVIASTPEIRWEEVERIKASLKQNNYLVDASRLAKNVLNELFMGCVPRDFGTKVLPFRRKMDAGSRFG